MEYWYFSLKPSYTDVTLDCFNACPAILEQQQTLKSWTKVNPLIVTVSTLILLIINIASPIQIYGKDLANIFFFLV